MAQNDVGQIKEIYQYLDDHETRINKLEDSLDRYRDADFKFMTDANKASELLHQRINVLNDCIESLRYYIKRLEHDAK